jgi:hypothetical protein
VVMAELLASSDGVGAALAVSRSHLDTSTTLAWICAVVSILLAVEYLLLEPIKREVERSAAGLINLKGLAVTNQSSTVIPAQAGIQSCPNHGFPPARE